MKIKLPNFGKIPLTDSEIEKQISWHKKNSGVITETDVRTRINSLKPKSYSVEKYSGESMKIITEKAKKAAESYAKLNVGKSFIFDTKKKEEKLLAQKIPEFIDFFKTKDEDAKRKFDGEQLQIKQTKDEEFIKQCEKQKHNLEKYFTSDENVVNSMLSKLKEVPDFVSLNATYKNEICNCMLVLPDKNIIEQRQAKLLASGRISVKKRAEKDIVSDWNICCASLILYVANLIFNVNTNIKDLNLVAKRTELNKATGLIETKNFGVFSFNREEFSRLNFQMLDPILAVESFKVRNQTSNINQTKKQTRHKSKYEIEKSDELSSDSLKIVQDAFEALRDKFDFSFFDDDKKLFSAIRDLLPNYDAEQNLIKIIAENQIFKNLSGKQNLNGTKKLLTEILSENNLTEIAEFSNWLLNFFVSGMEN